MEDGVDRPYGTGLNLGVQSNRPGGACCPHGYCWPVVADGIHDLPSCYARNPDPAISRRKDFFHLRMEGREFLLTKEGTC